MKKIILLLTFWLTLGVSLFGQGITSTNPTTPRVVTKNIVADTVYGSRYGSGQISDTIVYGSGIYFPSTGKYFDGDAEVDSLTFATKYYVDNEIDSLGALTNITYPDSSVLFVGSNGKPTTDSVKFIWLPSTLFPSLRVGARTTAISYPPLNFDCTGISPGFSTLGFGTAGSAPSLEIRKSRGTVTAPTAVQAGDRIGDLSFNGYNGATMQFTWRMRVKANETFRTSSYNSYLVFSSSYQGTMIYPAHMWHSGLVINPATENLTDTLFNFKVNGTAAITQTPESTNGTDSVVVKDPTSGQLKAVARGDVHKQVTDSITTDRTLTNADFGNLLIHNLTSNDTVTIDSGLTVDDFAFVDFENYGTGEVYIRAASGVTLNGVSEGTARLTIRYTGAFIRKIGTDEYIIIGVYE